MITPLRTAGCAWRFGAPFISCSVTTALGKLGIDARRQLAVTTYCVHTFFDHYLKGTGSSRLNLASPLYPEIQILE